MSYSTNDIPDSDKTPWQEGNPPCPGLWEREFWATGGHVGLAYWTGRDWSRASHFACLVDNALAYAAESGSGRPTRWRGLNFDPRLGRASV